MFKLSTSLIFVAVFSALAPVYGAPAIVSRHEGHSESSASSGSVVKDNALDAQKLNSRFATIKANDRCTSAEMACVEGGFAQCVAGKWVIQQCSNGLRCYALPLVNSRGTSLVCDTREDAELRFKNAGVTGGTKGDGASGSASTSPVDDDEDIPNCGDAEDGLESRSFDEDEEYLYFHRRQVETVPVTVATLPGPLATSSEVIASSSASASVSTSAPSASITAPNSEVDVSVFTSVPVATPTVVIGSDGIVTVTVVSTVFAAPTACTLETSSASIPTTRTVAIPSGSAAGASVSDIASSSTAVRSASASVASSTVRPISTIILRTSAAESTTVQPSTTATGSGRFTFGTAA